MHMNLLTYLISSGMHFRAVLEVTLARGHPGVNSSYPEENFGGNQLLYIYIYMYLYTRIYH